ncbi:MAG TPA: hypothetical protein PK156_14300 [Polyangium sp.]|nr:hypothetical protein [Polyangium sp.]
MTGHGQWLRRGAAWIFTALAVVGCGSEEPPYDELPLRDALRAAPEVVASLSFETRRDLAQRLDAAGFDQDGTAPFALPKEATVESLAQVADEAREEQGQDALILAEVLETPIDFVLQVEDIDAESLERSAVGPVVLRGRPSAQTQAFEDAALRGRAGKWLRELSGKTKTKYMVRTTGVPFGAWAREDTLYVNASWLVAMSALEKDGAGLAPGSLMPLSIDYNPYNLPDSVAQCTQQVMTTCQCGTSCTHEVTDPSFANANEECAWVNQDPSHPIALCVLALMSISDVKACMDNGAFDCPFSSVTTGDDSLQFVQNTSCMDRLDECLRNGYIGSSSGSGSGSSGGSSCSSCNNDWAKCNDNCSNCNNNWSSCNDNCGNTGSNCGSSGSNCGSSGGNCGGGSCGGGSCGGGSCGGCSIKPDPGRSPIPDPVRTTFWLFLPMAYVLLRGRRRS